jgi:ABC-type amino acid transport substrate-binding protein
LSAQARLTALQTGEIDLLARNTTYTLTRDTSAGLNFTVINYYDGQGFLVPKRLGANSARCDRLRTDRNHDRAQPRRLLQSQQHGLAVGHAREVRGDDRRLCRRSL